MSSGIEHLSEFINDTEKILDRLGVLLADDSLSILKIYREIHSLKGAAGFAGMVNMESLAHRLEELLTGIRDGKISLDEESEKILYKVHDFFNKDIRKWKNDREELGVSELLSLIDNKTAENKPIAIEVIDEVSSSKRFFTEFEETLLKEAMYRGENFYRVICHIDRDEEMKYPRLFLVINNLEKLTNVIKVDPSMDYINKNKSKEITLYLTTDKSKSYIYKGLSFDRIREVEFQRLDFSTFLNNKLKHDVIKENILYGKNIDVETVKVEEILNYFQDLNNKLLLENYIHSDKKASVEKLLQGMKTSLTSLTTISFNNAFSFFEDYCNTLGNKLGKKVKFTITNGDITIERQLAETLKEVLIQLIKNSIDHGIELPVERLKLNKPEVGTITLTIAKIKNSLAISLEDDGRGIDRNEILNTGVEGNFIEKDEELSLLSILSRPGFSTSNEINHYSGRGVGLDLVVNRVVNNMEGKIKIENQKGSGLGFHLLIPPSSSIKKFTLFKYRNSTFGISMINIVEKVSLIKENIAFGDISTLTYNYNGDKYPVFTPWGRLSSSQPLLEEKFGFILRYLGKKAFFPVDEFVLEKEYFSSVINLVDTDTPTHKSVIINNKKEDFTLLLPSVINA